jgi:hypothetical protein
LFEGRWKQRPSALPARLGDKWRRAMQYLAHACGPGQHMTTRAIAILSHAALAVAVCLFGAVQASGQGGHTWRLGSGPNGQITASIFSINTLSVGSSRVIDYHPVLTIACHPGGAPRWSLALQLKDPVSASGAINVSVRLDNGGENAEQWTPGFQGRGFSKDGSKGIARLLQAKRLRLSWRFGFLAGRGDAVFNLSGVKDAVAGLAGACGVEMPLS